MHASYYFVWMAHLLLLCAAALRRTRRAPVLHGQVDTRRIGHGQLQGCCLVVSEVTSRGGILPPDSLRMFAGFPQPRSVEKSFIWPGRGYEAKFRSADTHCELLL